jgi:hypothetical protein
VPKYTTEGRNAKRNMGVSSKTESVGTPRDQSSGMGGQRTDPSVRLGPLTGPAAHGEVDMAITMRKPQAYRK